MAKDNRLMTLPANVEQVLDWLAKSAVYRADGGVNQGYNWQEQSYPFVYCEITGYAVSSFVCAHRWTQDGRYLDLAQQSARFLIALQDQIKDESIRGAIPHGLTLPDEQVIRQYYSFDVAMCLQGLLDLHADQPSPALLESARGIGNWLITRMQQDNGSFLATYDAETDGWQHEGENFYDDYGCLHAKHAIGLLKLAQASGDEAYTTAALAVCDWVLTLQNDDGAIRANGAYPQVVSHPHCYATEGLLYAHFVSGDKRYLNAARKAGDWLLTARNSDGSISIEYNKPWWRMGRRVIEKVLPRRVTDATSQTLRIWLLLYYVTNDQRYLDAARKAGAWLQGMQCVADDDRNAAGGFYFWPGHPVMFTWASMFAAHALYALENVERDDGYRQLITELF